MIEKSYLEREDEGSLLLFGVGPQMYSVSTSYVNEVILLPPSFEEIRGKNFDGHLVYKQKKIDFWDLPFRFGFGREKRKDSYAIVFSTPSLKWGFLVSKIWEILLAPPQTIPFPQKTEWVEEIYQRESQTILKINPKRLMLSLTQGNLPPGEERR